LIDWSKEISGLLFVVMMERAGSAQTSVFSASSSPKPSQPSSNDVRFSVSKRPVWLD
jgi:hypothetical protein